MFTKATWIIDPLLVYWWIVISQRGQGARWAGAWIRFRAPASVPFSRLVLAVEYQADVNCDFFFLVSIFCLYTCYSPLPVNRRVLLIWAWSSPEGLPVVCLGVSREPRGNCDCDRCYINKAEFICKSWNEKKEVLSSVFYFNRFNRHFRQDPWTHLLTQLFRCQGLN